MGGKVRKKIVAWDVAPKEEYFQELFRISRDQIIWGGNYFSLPPNTRKARNHKGCGSFAFMVELRGVEPLKMGLNPA
jgi:hypothetical protein